MTYAIYKYPLEITDKQTIKVPRSAKFMCLKEQFDKPVTYWLVEISEKGTKDITFYLYGTGHYITAKVGEYIYSIMCIGGNFVGHVFCEQNIKES